MTDNPNYNLRRAVDRARAAADVSTDPLVHRVKLAMEGVQSAERYALERETHDAIHGEPDTSDLPPWSEISTPGEADYGPFTPPE